MTLHRFMKVRERDEMMIDVSSPATIDMSGSSPMPTGPNRKERIDDVLKELSRFLDFHRELAKLRVKSRAHLGKSAAAHEEPAPLASRAADLAGGKFGAGQ